MAEGQVDVIVTTDNLRLSVSKKRSTALGSGVLVYTPASEDESIVSAFAGRRFQQPSITFHGDSAAACPGSAADTGYVHLVVAKWGVNPNANSESVESSLFGAKMYTSSTVDADLFPDFKYYMTIPYSAKVQNFTVNKTDATEAWNVTIPACTSYNTATGAYEACSGCSLSTYDKDSATFECKDIAQVCSWTTSSSLSTGRRFSRQLLSFDDDYAATASEGNGNIEQIGTIFTAVPGELTKVVSFNPFTTNTKGAKVILSAMSSFFFLIVAGLVFFAKWDRKVVDCLFSIPSIIALRTKHSATYHCIFFSFRLAGAPRRCLRQQDV